MQSVTSAISGGSRAGVRGEGVALTPTLCPYYFILWRMLRKLRKIDQIEPHNS